MPKDRLQNNLPMNNHKNLVRVDPVHPDQTLIKKAGKILTQQGVVIFPAQCLYGVAANALDTAAVEKVFQIKQRPQANPILVLVRDKKALAQLVKTIPDQAIALMDAFWPGSITLVFEAADSICPRLTAHTGKIGIRLLGHPVAQALVKAVDFPITGTSANLSGQPGCHRVTDLDPAIARVADFILDSGQVRGGTGSTIVDVTQTPIKIVRQGAVPDAAVHKILA